MLRCCFRGSDVKPVAFSLWRKVYKLTSILQEKQLALLEAGESDGGRGMPAWQDRITRAVRVVKARGAAQIHVKQAG